MPEPLTSDDVRHIADLARLGLTDEQLEAYRGQLAAVLDHIAHLNELDVSGVEPMAHPTDVTNRLADDVPTDSLATDDVLRNAPATLESFLTVPKIIDQSGGGDPGEVEREG